MAIPAHIIRNAITHRACRALKDANLPTLNCTEDGLHELDLDVVGCLVGKAKGARRFLGCRSTRCCFGMPAAWRSERQSCWRACACLCARMARHATLPSQTPIARTTAVPVRVLEQEQATTGSLEHAPRGCGKERESRTEVSKRQLLGCLAYQSHALSLSPRTGRPSPPPPSRVASTINERGAFHPLTATLQCNYYSGPARRPSSSFPASACESNTLSILAPSCSPCVLGLARAWTRRGPGTCARRACGSAPCAGGPCCSRQQQQQQQRVHTGTTPLSSVLVSRHGATGSALPRPRDGRREWTHT